MPVACLPGHPVRSLFAGPGLAQRVIALVILVLAATARADTPPAAAYAGGSGTEPDPYQIATLAELRRLSETPADWSAHFRLTAFIDALDTATWNGGLGFSPIGSSGQPFLGSFDGQGFAIAGLTIARPSEDFLGLFGRTGGDSIIEDLLLEDLSVTGKDFVGGLAGLLDTDTRSVGVWGRIAGDTFVGGLAGYLSQRSVTDSYTVTTVTSDADFVGGLIGAICCNASVVSTYAAGAVAVAGGSNVGGLLGSNDGGTVTTSYWDTDASGLASGVGSGDATGVTGLTTAEMTQAVAFAGFDFANTWTIVEGVTRPYLPGQELPAAVAYAAGDGTAGNPYRLSTLSELRRLSETPSDWSSHFVLTADIDASATADWNGGAGFAPIGRFSAPFLGSIDGRGFAITGLTIDRPSELAVGLFGYAGAGAAIDDVHVIDADITGGSGVGGVVGTLFSGGITASSADGDVAGTAGVGGLVGSMSEGEIESSHSAGTVSGIANGIGGLAGAIGSGGLVKSSHATSTVKGASQVGGLIGSLQQADVASSYATGPVNGTDYVGGLIGRSSSPSSVTSSAASGAVTGSGFYIGGLVGYWPVGTIASSYAAGPVRGDSNVGGLVGSLAPVSAIVTSSYASGSVSGGTNVGAFAGDLAGGGVSDSYYDTDTAAGVAAFGQGTSAGVTGLTSLAMTRPAQLNGFDFTTTWTIVEGITRPYLPGQEVPAALAYAAGDGTAVAPYQLSTLSELRRLSETTSDWDRHFVLAADIDASNTRVWHGGLGFSPIGSRVLSPLVGFRGSFDGKGYVISGLVIDRPGTGSSAGFFDSLGVFNLPQGSGVGDVRYLQLEDVRITGDYVGALAARVESSGSITTSRATGRVSGYVAGGLVGLNAGSLASSHAAASVYARAEAGGLVGWNGRSGKVTFSYATGSVEGGSRTGGLFGRVEELDRGGNIASSYAANRVAGPFVGGILGFLATSTSATGVSSSYWDTELSGVLEAQGPSSGLTTDGATGLTSDQMLRSASFDSGFGLGSEWDIIEGFTRPFLPWQAQVSRTPPPNPPQVVDTVVGYNQVTLTVAPSGDSTVSGYVATCVDGGGDDFVGRSTSTRITVSGLTNGVAYTCTVVAINATDYLTSAPSDVTPSLIPDDSGARLITILGPLLLD